MQPAGFGQVTVEFGFEHVEPHVAQLVMLAAAVAFQIDVSQPSWLDTPSPIRPLQFPWSASHPV